MELAYKKLMADEKLQLSELPKAAQLGIKEVDGIAKGIHMTEKRGYKVKEEVIAKLKENDQWVVEQILEYLEKKNAVPAGEPVPTPTPEEKKKEEEKVVPHAAEEVIEEIKADEQAAEVKVDERGIKIDAELKALLEANVSKMTFDEMKSKAPNAYSLVFDNYKEGEENGVETSYYKLVESEPKVFTITKI